MNKTQVQYDMMPNNFGAIVPTTTPTTTDMGGKFDIGDVENILGDITSIFGHGTTSAAQYSIPPTGYYYTTTGQLLPLPGAANKTTTTIVVIIAAAALLFIILLIAKRK
jgi:hypothetical protein